MDGDLTMTLPAYRFPQPQSVSADYQGLRVVHAANYQFAKDGLVFFNPDLKINQGLIQNGCFVYPFSINDRARMLSLIRSKTWGKGKANKALIRTCLNVAPDLLVIGHAQFITLETLQEIRRHLPEMKIAFWYFDALWDPKRIEHIYRRLEALDAVVATSGGKWLKSLSRPHCPAGFIPNPVEPACERLRAFENERPQYDLVFFGADKGAPERRAFLERLVTALPQAKLGIFGSLGHPFAFGAEKDAILANSRMALNLNRRNDVELYSSDRIAQLTGNGLLTLTPSGAGLEQLYSTDEVAYYSDVEDLAATVMRLKANDAEARAIAERGWRKSHLDYSSFNVVRFMLDLTYRNERYQSAPWGRHVYWGAD